MAQNKLTRYQKSKKNLSLPLQEVKFALPWWWKCFLMLTWPLWIIPFLVTNLIIGLLVRNSMEKIQTTGVSNDRNFAKINLNSLAFYNRDMELQNCPQLMIDDAQWQLMHPQDVTITSFDNVPLSAFLFINYQPNANHKWIIAVHGWQQNRYRILYLVKHFYQQGYHVLTYDARGHGTNFKTSLTFGFKEATDLYSVIRYVNDYCHRNDPQTSPNISLIGNSMGATTILQAAVHFELQHFGVKCAIVDSGYDKFSNIIKLLGIHHTNIHWWWFYYGAKFYFQIRDRFNVKAINSVDKLKYCANLPMLFIHGSADETVPLAMTKRLFDTKINHEIAPIKSELLIIKHAKHVRAITTDYQLYTKTTLNFVNKYTTTKEQQ